MTMPTYMRRYTFRILGFVMAYAGALFGAITLMKSASAPSGAAAFLVAAIPGLCVAGMVWAVFQLVIECDDEYQRMLFVKQVLLATGATLTLATVWGFLENFDLVVDLPGYHVTILWFVMIGIAGAIVRWRA